jgi:tRNA-dihydrouridine synthase B
MQIGDFNFPTPIALAPMAGISDAPFRQLCRKLGANLTPSEMISADVSLWTTAKSRYRLKHTDDNSPRIIQIAGYDEEMLADAAQSAVEQGAAIIDINMGCPAKKVCKRFAGSSLLRDPLLVRRILDRVVARVRVPVTLKMRTGWCPDSRNGVLIAKIAEESGVAALTVHGRTRDCRFSGDAEYDTIRSIKRAVDIPVVANGDIDSPQKAAEVLEYTGADAIMIGRAARGRPWIFSAIRNFLSNATDDATELSLPSFRDIIFNHLDSLYSFYGEARGVRVGRKHLCWYAHYQEGGDAFRKQVVRVETAREQLELTRAFFNRSSRSTSVECVRSGRERGGENDKQKKNSPQEKEEACRNFCIDGSPQQAA